MALPEIHSYKTGQDPVLPTVTNMPFSESVKEEDIAKSLAAVDIDTSKRSEEVKKAAEEKIQRVSELMNNYVRSLQKDIKIQVNSETGDVIVKVISEEDGKVIREIPSEELLALAARMEEIAGVFFDQIV